MDCLSMTVYFAINECFGDDLSSYLFGVDDHESLGVNFRPACTHEAPPHGVYRHCKNPTAEEYATMTELFTIAMTFAIKAGVNWFAICCAGDEEKVVPKYIDQLKVDDSLTSDLCLNNTFVAPPLPGRLEVVRGSVHLSTFSKFNSTSADKQCNNVCAFLRKIGDALSTFQNDTQAGPIFIERALSNEVLTLNQLNAREIKARADAQEKRNQKNALLQANRTEAEIEQARLKHNASIFARRANSVDCEHCGNPYPSTGKGTNHCCPYNIVQVGLECRQICQKTKIVEGVTMRCGIRKYKKSSGFYSRFCGSIDCLTDSQKREKNWFQL
jgi:hypothetical protein